MKVDILDMGVQEFISIFETARIAFVLPHPFVSELDRSRIHSKVHPISIMDLFQSKYISRADMRTIWI